MTQEEKEKQIMLALHLIKNSFYGNYKGDVKTQCEINKIAEECEKKIENYF